MLVNVRGKNIDVTDALNAYVEKRLQKLGKLLNGAGEAQVTLSVERDSHRVEVTIPINGILLRGEEATPDMYASVDLVVEKLEKQVDKFKGRLGKRVRTTEAREPIVDDYEDPFSVVRVKRFAIKPMKVEEAVMQMNLLGHSFFVFSNADTEEVNVLYRRRDGNYGLIEPE